MLPLTGDLWCRAQAQVGSDLSRGRDCSSTLPKASIMYVLLETYVCDSCHGFHHDHALLMIVCIDKCMICLLYADESRSCLLLCARRVHVCAVLVRLVAEILRQDGRTCVYLHRTLTDANWFLDSAVPVGPGPRAWRPVLLLWLPCIQLQAWPLALAEPNAEPTTFWLRTSAPWCRAGPGPRLASWAGHMPIQARPGPRPNYPWPTWPTKVASELQGSTHRGGGFRAQRSGEDTNQGRDTQGTCIWISAAAAAGRGTRRWRHHPGKQTHTGLSLGYLVSIDMGMLNENRVGVVDWNHTGTETSFK